VPNAILSYSGSYVGSYYAVSNDIYAVTYNSAADELIVAGNILDQGAPGIQGLDPTTFAVKWSLPTPSIGDVLAVSDDGSKAYVGLCEQMSVAQIDLGTHSIDSVFSISPSPNNLCAGDIAVRPGYPSVIAVTQMVQGVLAPRSFGTAMFNNGAPLPNAVNDGNNMFFMTGSEVYTGSATIQFLDSNNLIGYSSLTTDIQIQRYSTSGSGLTLTEVQRANSIGDYFSIHNGQLYFNTGNVSSATDLSGNKVFTHCQTQDPAFYSVAIPDPTRPEILCATSVPYEQRLNPRDIELELTSWALHGERATRRTHLNLHDVIQIPGSIATAEVYLKKMLALPNGRVILHISDFQSYRFLLVSIDSADIATVSAPPISYGHLEQSGTTIDQVDLPVTATAYDPNANRVYGLVSGSYGPNGSSLAALDYSSKQVIGFVPLDYEPTMLSISSDGQYAYVSDGLSNIQQIDLNSLTLGWSWDATDCCISSMTLRPGYPQQLVADSDKTIHFINGGIEASSFADPHHNYPGTALFTDSNRIIEFLPSIASSNVNIYNIASSNLVSNGQFDIGFSSGGGAYRDFTGSGFVYNDAGEVADQNTLAKSNVAPPMLYYSMDTSANMSVTFPNGNLGGSCGCSILTAFTPLSSTRFLAARQQMLGAAMFDVMTGNQLSGRLIITDPIIGQSFLQPTQINTSTITFGQNSGVLGKGSLYLIQFSY